MHQVFNIMVLCSLALNELFADYNNNSPIFSVIATIAFLFFIWILYKAGSYREPIDITAYEKDIKNEEIKKKIETEQKKLENEILLEMTKGIAIKTLKKINPMNLKKSQDKFVQGFEEYLGYSTVYDVDDVLAFKPLIETIKEKCAKTGLDPYSIEPQDIVKCVYIIMSRAEIIAKKNQRIFADFNFKEVFATQSSSYDIRGDYDDIATHKKFTYIYAKNELDDIINDEIRKFIEKFSNKN
ncbi:hypothetical protein [Campylobacter sp.]|uniref:hypothetical protein n=1 Tax=Campylobacter sp. TaxID=205 RepID=UPI002AA837EE|nr:hypothetical protein [Campylobacter sp.]MCI7237315.1 hypothetical protein [Campylobacter sp.]